MADTSEEAKRGAPDKTAQANELLGEAVLLRAQSKPQQAMAKCRDALRLNPQSAEAFEILGDLYGESGLVAAALEAYKRALEIDASRATAETKIARLVLQQDRSDRQRLMAQRLLEGGKRSRPGRRPATAGLLSLIMPGLGQAYNRQWIKGVIILVILIALLMGVLGALSGLLTAQQTQQTPTDLFAALGLLFAPPALWWVLLLVILYFYSVIDAAMAATRAEAEEEEFI